mmetsp:Transcript_95234/g.213291  ORF Transcript_95234/g.213291 Transcript_95234/m.213291 type:complete len:272 (-) Transcript_95234:1327-2142(-)
MAMSASLLTFVSSMSENLQMIRKVSPLLRLAAPWNSSTTPCTISAMRLTKVITLAWSTSVAIEKSLILVAPMMHSTRVPSTMASTQALSTPCMLCSMILLPASPKPRANKDPSLMMVFSKMTVSMSSPSDSRAVHVSISQTAFNQCLACFRCCRLCAVIVFLTSSILSSSSATFMAKRGFSRMVSTFAIMVSTGYNTKLLASLVKSREAKVKAKQRKIVTVMENTLSFSTDGLVSKKKAKCHASCASALTFKRGMYICRSDRLKSLGHLAT